MISSTTWTVLRFMLLAAALLLIDCNAIQSRTKCYRLTPKNKLVPTSDIDILVGKDVIVDCVDFSGQNESAGKLSWTFNQSKIPIASTEERNSTTLRLTLENATAAQTGYYKCLDDSTSRGICLTRIRIGYKPLPVLDFTCTAFNLEYMVCMWTSPYNPVLVNYSLTAIYGKSPYLFTSLSKPSRPSRKLNTSIYFYNFTISSEIVYVKYQKVYDFMLIGVNSLGRSSWNFTINHFERVVPGRVKDLQVTPRSYEPRTYNLTYSMSYNMKYFDPGLIYRIMVKSQWEDTKTTIESNETWITLPNLQPFTNYNVNVTCLSSVANRSDESLWSLPSSIEFRTLPDVPDEPPEIVPGSFRLVSFLTHSDVILYWKGIPDSRKNGERFNYSVIAQSLSTKAITQINTSLAYATFSNLNHRDSYKFSLYSQNEIGTSIYNSSIIVTDRNSLLDTPGSITVIAYSLDFHNVKWLAPKNTTRVTGYRIFWIESDTIFQKNPKGNLFWKDVDSSVLRVNITVSGKWPYHSFGVSSIGEDSASGIIWNTCIVLFNGTIGKLKKTDAASVSATEISVRWNIDCAEKLGILVGYKVYYCMIKQEKDEICQGDKQEVFQRNVNAVDVIIGDLKPFTWYKFTVTAVTEAGEGEHSHPIIARTLEAAPETATSGMELVEATNSSFMVKWHAPNVTNGEITYYHITYEWESGSQSIPYKPEIIQDHDATYLANITKKVLPYTNYSVTIQACTKGGCSPYSTKKTILTDVGVPRQMDPPQVRLVNMSYAVVRPEINGGLNGPSLTWDVKAIVITNDNHTKDIELSNLTGEMEYIRVNCEDPNLVGATLEWTTRAANRKDSEVLIGDWSDYTKINCDVNPDFPVGFIVAIVVGCAFGLAILIIATYLVTRQVKILVKKCREVKIILPPGLTEDEYQGCDASHKQHHKNIYTRADRANGTSIKLLDDDSRTRNASGDTTQSSGSTEEGKWGNDSIGSGNHDSISSRPSTTQTQLSSESSLELVPSVPESPDSVFNDHPLKVPNGIATIAQYIGNGTNGNAANNSSNNGFNPTLTPIGETLDGGSSQSGTPQHYSKFAGYYGSAHNSPSNKRGHVIQNGYVAAPYSKFGVGIMGGPSNGGGNGRAGSPSSRYSLEDNEPPLLSYSKVGLSIPLFGEQQSADAFHKGISASSSPLTSTPTHVVTGYSVLGLGQNNPACETVSNVGPFSQPPPVAVSSPVEGTSKGYVLAAAMNNIATQPPNEAPLISTEDEDCDPSQSTLVEGMDSPNYINLNAHKRSPSNSSSLTAGYCRLGLSRPTSMCSETDQNCVRAESQTGGAAAVCSPVMSSCRNSTIDMVSGAGSPSHNGGGGIACNPVNSATGLSTTAVGSSGPNGYATMQQLLQEKGNS